MDGLIKCPFCNKWLIEEEITNHQCNQRITDIEYKWCSRKYQLKDCEIFFIKDVNNTLYRCKLPIKIRQKVLSDENLQHKQSDEDFTEP